MAYEEKRGIMIDPLEWAKKNRHKLKTIKVGNSNVTPQMMIRDNKRDVIQSIQFEDEKDIHLSLKYREFVLFHRICYSLNLTPKQFIETLTSSYEINNEELMNWLASLKERGENKELNKKIYLTEDELYTMLEKAVESEKKNGKGSL